MSAPLRVAVIEDDPRYRRSLERLLASSDGFALAGSFANAPAALDDVRRHDGAPPHWDLVLMDLDLPQMKGVEAIRRLKVSAPSLPVVALTVFEEPATILDAICAGADGYLLKRMPPYELLGHLRSIASGGAPLTSRVARTVLDLLRQDPASRPRAGVAGPRVALTARELEVLQALVRGLSYKQVADDLAISLDTVRTHIRGVYRKLQVHSVAEAVGRAIRERLV